jgi:PAS domain S-box-containing protein
VKYDSLSKDELLKKVVSFEQELKGYVNRLDERYKVFFERNLAGIYRSKINGKIVECNDALAEILGYESKEELIGSDAKMLYQNINDREKHLELLRSQKFIKNKKLALFKKDGTKIWVSISTTEISNKETGEMDYMEGTIIDITELIHTQELLEHNEQNYKAMLDESPYGIIIINKNKVEYFNHRAEKILKIELNKKTNIEKLFPSALIKIKNEEINQGDLKHLDRVEFNAGTEPVFLDMYVKPILFENKQMTELSFVDIQDRIELEEEKIKTGVFQKLNNQLKAEIAKKERIENELIKSLELNQNQAAKLTESLKEKDILIKEVHHRVKNNLQVISSIFNLQNAYSKNEGIKEVLKESQNRIKSMAYIHESLYKSSQLGKIDFEEYVSKLCNNLIRSYAIRDNQISLLTETEKVLLHLDQAIPCGLMVNEIISNSLKHAFPAHGRGIIAINLRCRKNRVKLRLSDDGIGIPANILRGETNTLGMQLIETLVEQIRGELKIDTEMGSSFELEFDLQQ